MGFGQSWGINCAMHYRLTGCTTQVNWKLRLFNGVMGGLMAITAVWLLVEEWLNVIS
ncbi:hypothetical protein [Yersinia similis]|uniref:hypothetical protein n=1 Tax=Yersinia similis TaxID=367190 RepID=UPI0004B97BC6|nr:hypothetical protein [Yersinia similis]